MFQVPKYCYYQHVDEQMFQVPKYSHYCINMSKTSTMSTDALLLNVYVPVIEHVLSNLSTVVKFTEEGSSMIIH